SAPPNKAVAIVALGGDGLMLQTMHAHLNSRIPIYGMNRGSIGFLLNDYHEDNLKERLEAAETTVIHPLRMTAYDKHGVKHEAVATNEVALLRQDLQGRHARDTGEGKSPQGWAYWCGVAVPPARRQHGV